MSQAEIAALRAEERSVQEATSIADRICRDLVGRYACDFVCVATMPYQTWAKLPEGWQRMPNVKATIRRGCPPRDLRGAVGVSLETIRWIARE